MRSGSHFKLRFLKKRTKRNFDLPPASNKMGCAPCVTCNLWIEQYFPGPHKKNSFSLFNNRCTYMCASFSYLFLSKEKKHGAAIRAHILLSSLFGTSGYLLTDGLHTMAYIFMHIFFSRGKIGIFQSSFTSHVVVCCNLFFCVAC